MGRFTPFTVTAACDKGFSSALHVTVMPCCAQIAVKKVEDGERRVAESAAKQEEAARKTQQLWAAALASGWDDGGRMCRSAAEAAGWCADLALRFELAQKREADATAAGSQVRSA